MQTGKQLTPVRKIRPYLPQGPFFPTVSRIAGPRGIRMLEFVFFDPRPCQRFADFLRVRDVSVEKLEDGESCGVGIPEDTDDNLMDKIEACYEEMMAFDQELGEVVNAIVDAVENPDRRSLCHRPDRMD
jgi:hypothetical protein